MLNEQWSDFLVCNEGWVRCKYPNGELVIFSDDMSKPNWKIIEERCDLQRGDQIVWVKDLPKKILAEYKKQIEVL